ncbi:hypothetical protein MUG78_05510 [Gordonia alkaliphila]|uniref:hypothetical protein n=1 Tax=Gordonia alkaliphila TaxID=1053547 RepID=UPI001FF339E5|nr:hypothetical protein [Gordonia alkaliphila]MCK0438935.1 hypothetical protein [Gordonia alkaliphila]
MVDQPTGFSEEEYLKFADLFRFWGERYSEIGVRPDWSGIAPQEPHGYPAMEISAREIGGDPGYILRREGALVHQYWIERGSLDDMGEFRQFSDALKAMSILLASGYRRAKGYEPLYSKLDGIMPEGVEVSSLGDVEVYRIVGGDPDRYFRVYGDPGGLLPYMLAHSLSEVNADLLRP